MLYVTTRDKANVITSYPTLTADTGPCGGLYIPFQPLSLSKDELKRLQENSFCECVADILNMFFSSRLDAWDIASCMGTSPVKLIPMTHKITVIEIWNNPDWSFSRFVRNLNGRLIGSADTGEVHNWGNIAIRIAVLFGVFSKVMNSGLISDDKTIDLSVVSGDFSTPVAAWYARKMGLPIGNIIFACNENSESWELMHHGEANLRTRIKPTLTSQCDVLIPQNMELLIHETLGEEAVTDFSCAIESKGIYSLDEEQMQLLNKGIFGAVVGQNRMESIIRNVYATKAYILSPYSALAYGGLQDYRATKGESRQALILTEHGPLTSDDFVAKAIGITKEALRERIGAV